MTRVLVLFAALTVHSAPLAAQSLFGSAGLGLPIDAADGRARALGGVGLGLSGSYLLPADPAAAARIRIPTGILVAQPSWSDATDGDRTNYFSGTRFPLLAAAYPLFGGTATLHFASILEQDFQGSREVQITLGGAPVTAFDDFEQDGTVSAMNVGFARMFGEETSVGIQVGRYTGTVSRTLVRTIEDSSAGSTVQPYVSGGSWSYSGYLVSGGVAATLLDLMNVSASATWSTDLEAEASSATDGGDGSFDVPLQLRLGVSAPLAPGLTLNAGATRADWSAVTDDLGDGTRARTTHSVGVGLELTQARLFARDAPLRLGYRYATLPFAIGQRDAHERVFSGGLGLLLNQTGELVLANVDLAVERGRRRAGSLTEHFWRATLSLSVAGL